MERERRFEAGNGLEYEFQVSHSCGTNPQEMLLNSQVLPSSMRKTTLQKEFRTVRGSTHSDETCLLSSGRMGKKGTKCFHLRVERTWTFRTVVELGVREHRGTQRWKYEEGTEHWDLPHQSRSRWLPNQPSLNEDNTTKSTKMTL